ncbi:MAG TPA: histidine kinase [Chitinophagaceae bacterium]|jgi:sensor histidine kinase YesM
MNPWKPTRTEWITFFALMPVSDVVFNYLFFGNRIWNDFHIWLYSFPIIYVQGWFSWYLHIGTMHWYRVELPLLKQTLPRLTLLFFSHIALTSLIFASLLYVYDVFHFLGYSLNAEKLKISVLIAVVFTLLTTTFWEAEYVLIKWKESLSEKEKLEQLSIQHEFETLKGQVNPHFLFNCFNTLSSLINEDRKQAEVFLNELSKVYRYLLSSNEDGLSTVQQELNFIHSYYQLLKTRYGDAIQMQVEVDRKYNSYLLPSLSLQLLVENAVKHNIISKQDPLIIDIFSTAGSKLAVSNQLQLKIVKALSNKIGLENIRAKYELLKQPGFQVLEDAKNFTVILPLIWNYGNKKQFPFVQKNEIKNQS